MGIGLRRPPAIIVFNLGCSSELANRDYIRFNKSFNKSLLLRMKCV